MGKQTLDSIEEKLADLKAKGILTQEGLTHAIRAYKEENKDLKA